MTLEVPGATPDPRNPVPTAPATLLSPASPSVADNVTKELAGLLSLSVARTKRDYRRLAHLSASLAGLEPPKAQGWADVDTAELDALLAQYVSLRDESMNTINNRIQILLLGVAAVGALIGGALTIDDPTAKPLVVRAVFSLAIPLVAVFVLFVWISEAVRSHRVGYFLAADAEARINAKLGRLVMSWEAGLWAGNMPRDELFGPSMMALGVFGLVAAAAPFCGLALTGIPPRLDVLLSPAVLQSRAILIPFAIFAAAIGYVVLNWRRLKNEDVIISTLADPVPSTTSRPK